VPSAESCAQMWQARPDQTTSSAPVHQQPTTALILTTRVFNSLA
jgi:hypothetical protein